MKISVLTALVAQSSAVGLAPHNEHLTATYILNDAAVSVSDLIQKTRARENLTNTDYIKELDRRLAHINWERKHVMAGEL